MVDEKNVGRHQTRLTHRQTGSRAYETVAHRIRHSAINAVLSAVSSTHLFFRNNLKVKFRIKFLNFYPLLNIKLSTN